MANKSGNIDHEFGTGGTGFTLRISWEETAVNVTSNSSTVKCVAKLIAKSGNSISDTASKSISITCDGTTKSSTCKVNVSSGSTITMYTATFTVAHNSSGAKTAAISCRLDIDTTISGNHVSYVSGSGSAALTTIPSPNAPTSCTITAGYGSYVAVGDTITVRWSGESGTITGYELQISHGNSGWKAWKMIDAAVMPNPVTGTITATAMASTGAGKQAKVRIRALCGTLTSSWKESNALTITGGVKLKASSTWKQGTVWIKVGGTWKRAKRIWIKVGGTWKYSK